MSKTDPEHRDRTRYNKEWAIRKPDSVRLAAAERRRQAYKLFEEGRTREDVAHIFQVTYTSASNWHLAWQAGKPIPELQPPLPRRRQRPLPLWKQYLADPALRFIKHPSRPRATLVVSGWCDICGTYLVRKATHRPLTDANGSHHAHDKSWDLVDKLDND